MTEINVICPKCQKLIKIQVKTTDEQKIEIQRLKAKLFELENQVKASNIFGRIFKGEKK